MASDQYILSQSLVSILLHPSLPLISLLTTHHHSTSSSLQHISISISTSTNYKLQITNSATINMHFVTPLNLPALTSTATPEPSSSSRHMILPYTRRAIFLRRVRIPTNPYAPFYASLLAQDYRDASKIAYLEPLLVSLL